MVAVGRVAGLARAQLPRLARGTRTPRQWSGAHYRGTRASKPGSEHVSRRPAKGSSQTTDWIPSPISQISLLFPSPLQRAKAPSP
jgi:hypothetical protein